MESKLTKNQKKAFGPRPIDGYGTDAMITATVRYDDECGNGRNSFAITAEVRRPRAIDIESGGCMHDEIARLFPELAKYIKWHLCDARGPMHYIANTLYFAWDRDHNGLRKDERRQIRNGKTGLPAWRLEATATLPQYVDAEECPPETATLRYVPWDRIGEGKERELDKARRAAIWPEATDAELCAPDLKERLIARLPALMADFKAAVESLGFVY